MVPANYNPHIFKTYDIRGKYGTDLTPDIAELIGKSLGTYFYHIAGHEQVVIGYDMRESSVELYESLAEGILSTGVEVLNIGRVATPVLYSQAYAQGTAGVMITGSHLAAEFNGFKMVVGLKPVWGDDIQAFYELIRQGIYREGRGQVYDIYNVNDAYKTQLAASFRQGRQLKVVVDGGNGMGGFYAPDILRQQGHEVVEMYCEPDGTFPNHHPNPEKAENMQELAAKVVEVGADVGLAFDGDADRVGVVDERGNHISADKIMAWLATDILPRFPEGAKFVGDVLSSQVVFQTVEDFGGEALMWASGHARIKSKMQSEQAVFGGESSGHMFFADRYPGFDDGIYAAGRIVEMLSTTDVTLSAQLSTLPQYFTTPEYRPHCAEDKKAEVIQRVKVLLGREKIVDVDGLRVMFAEGWGLLRPSGTEPVLSLRFEASSEEFALGYKDYIKGLLQEAYPEVEDF